MTKLNNYLKSVWGVKSIGDLSMVAYLNIVENANDGYELDQAIVGLAKQQFKWLAK